MKIKKTLVAVLAALILLSAAPFAAASGPSNWGEGNTLESALSQLRIGFHENHLDWLVLPNLGVIEHRYTYFLYRNARTGQVEEHPVYCIDPTRGGAHEIVRDVGSGSDGNRTATYIRGERVGDFNYMSIPIPSSLMIRRIPLSQYDSRTTIMNIMLNN